MKTLRLFTFATTLFVIASFVAAENPPAGGQPPAAPDAKKGSEIQQKAADELAAARKRLLDQKSVSANLTETISLQARTIRGTGRYVQGSLNTRNEGWHLRSELKIKFGNTEGEQLEVCDGDILWTRTEIRTVGKSASSGSGSKAAKDAAPDAKPDSPAFVTRRNVQQIMKAASARKEIPQDLLLADLGLGGMPALLASFQQSLQFDKLTTETMNGRPVLVFEGTWSDQQYTSWRINPKDIATTSFAPFVPERVQLFLDQESGFPHRIVYYKKLKARDGVLSPLLTIEYTDLRINEPLDKSEFVFVPPEHVAPMDLTKSYVERLSPPQAPGGAPVGPGAVPGTTGSPSIPGVPGEPAKQPK